MRSRVRRFECLEDRRLLAALNDTALVAENSLASSSVSIAEGEEQSDSALYDLLVALGTAEHQYAFGEYLYYHNGASGTLYVSGQSGGSINTITDPSTIRSIWVDPPTTILQFADVTDQPTQLGDRDLVVSDDRYVYHLRGGDLVISSVVAEGDPVVLSSTLVSGNHVSLFLVQDRVAVVSNQSERDSRSEQGVVTVFDVADRESPRVVQELRVEGELSHARLNGHQLVFTFQSSRELVPAIRRVIDEVGVRYETEQEFANRVRIHFAEIVDEHMPHYLSADGTSELIRGGPILNATRVTVLPGVNKNLAVVGTVNLLDDEPGIGSAVGITATARDVFAATDGFYLIGSGDQENEIFRFRLRELNGDIQLVARGRWLASYTAPTSDYFGEKLFIRDHFVSGGDTSSVNVAVVEQHGTELTTTQTAIDLGDTATSTQFHAGELFVVYHRNYQFGRPTESAVNDHYWYSIPTETEIRAVDLTDPAEPKWRSADILLDGFYTYLNFISDDRLLAAGTRSVAYDDPNEITRGSEISVSSGNLYEFRGSVSLYDLSSDQAMLLDSMETIGSTGGAIDNEENPFRWFDDEGLLAFPVSVDTGTFGWSTTNGWSGGDAVSWVRIDSEEKAFDQITPLATHNHADRSVVRHSAVVEGAIFSISDGQSFATSLDAGDSEAASQEFGEYSDEDAGSNVNVKNVRTLQARQYLVSTREVETSDLTLAGIEVREDYSDFDFVEGSKRFLVRHSLESGFSLMSESSASIANLHHNAGTPFDANRDGRVTAADALVIINALYRDSQLSEPTMHSQSAIAPMTGMQMDTNNDSELTAGDALLVINHLARVRAAEASISVADDAPQDEQEVSNAVSSSSPNEGVSSVNNETIADNVFDIDSVFRDLYALRLF